MKVSTRIPAMGTMIIIFLLCAAPAMAGSQMPKIFKDAGCTMCHRVEGKLVGPGFAWVADKYKDDKENGKAAIINQIINGGQGKWTMYTGGIMMPPIFMKATEEQLNELADYILSLDPMAPPEM
jgi:cytochrome c